MDKEVRKFRPAVYYRYSRLQLSAHRDQATIIRGSKMGLNARHIVVELVVPVMYSLPVSAGHPKIRVHGKACYKLYKLI